MCPGRWRSYVLAEIVESGRDAVGADSAADFECVVEPAAGYESR
jgi:hypothetical protein